MELPSGKKVLVIEDHPAIRHLVSVVLERFDLHLIFANDGLAGLEAIDAHEPDLVLLDLRLPGRSGFHVLERIKGDAALCHIPVLILSSSIAPPDVTRAYKGYANTYLRKPASFGKLVEMMATVDDYWRNRAELACSD